MNTTEKNLVTASKTAIDNFNSYLTKENATIAAIEVSLSFRAGFDLYGKNFANHFTSKEITTYNVAKKIHLDYSAK